MPPILPALASEGRDTSIGTLQVEPDLSIAIRAVEARQTGSRSSMSVQSSPTL
jgi:hypothetical protein